MPKIRIYLEKDFFKDQNILLEINQIHYLKNVMRKKNGDKIIAFNGHEEWSCLFNLKNEISLKPIERLRAKKKIPDIWICFSLVKKRSINNLVEKISEIGLGRIIPIYSEFSEKLKLNIGRLKNIAIEATEQCNAITPPLISEIKDLGELIQNWDKERLIILCDETGGDSIFSLSNSIKKSKKIAIFIGPVGGWSLKDRKIFYEKEIFRVSLGKNILKADTAAIFSLSCVRALMA